jgi:hypothetical protein
MRFAPGAAARCFDRDRFAAASATLNGSPGRASKISKLRELPSESSATVGKRYATKAAPVLIVCQLDSIGLGHPIHGACSGALGPVYHYSDTWQLVINTATTIVAFLMVFSRTLKTGTPRRFSSS